MTHVVRYETSGAVRVGVLDAGAVRPVPGVESMGDLLARGLGDARAAVESAADQRAVPVGEVRLLAPVDGLTEVWASGVTYERSMDARIEESQTQDVYTRVYVAERPELFFKSAAWRVVTDGEPIGMRPDSALTVPEPELAAVVTAHGEVFGYTVCDDVSSRDIEGENPLYLPAGEGVRRLAVRSRPASGRPGRCPTRPALGIIRAGASATAGRRSSGTTSTARMRRSAAPTWSTHLVRAHASRTAPSSRPGPASCRTSTSRCSTVTSSRSPSTRSAR